MFKKTIKTVLIASVLSSTALMQGCATVETLGDYLNANPIFANTATRQAVGRYIAAGKTPEAEQHRAHRVHSIIGRVMDYVDGNPQTSIDNLMAVANTAIDWEGLSYEDSMLVEDILALIESELRKAVPDKSLISDSTALALKTIFSVAISAADRYINAKAG